ncbi:[LSU ribosomal protein L11P]-lysine N-methyltransferase [Thermosyntropha lipolytica DSM 11003]|uniref:Ribosomal protein L11 methyltransferase n=1 Tax=Thermosyntropha lipolytica DSM 11003 TaxID=1123382 RepID=A0A1M5N7N4_9FIRM|nr:50S ribosomal protein L11 methyltransferase [Thermosyntropha lipolytica]SHG85485.1 [LSU ribosomal protein L11P]-lysine N-methyltransferase [Thermosyntropha lipolytica DSM 11003]
MKWKEISVVTEGICAEAVAGIFHQLGSGGVVIEDFQAARRYENQHSWNPGMFSPDFYDHDFVVIKAYFSDERQVLEDVERLLAKVEANFGVKCRVFLDEVKDEDWEESWKKYYHTFKVGDRIVIKPSWEEYEPQAGEIVVEIDPGMAFGTGIHASTRFCLRFLDKYLKGGEKVVDAGCGSGILSIAAVKLGAARVWAMDIDDVAVKVARENVKLNGLEDKIQVEEGDIIEKIAQLEVDMVLANITAEVINELLPEAARALKEGGWFFGSGIVDSRFPGVQQKLDECGFVIEEILTDVDWVGVAARKIRK